MLRLSLSAALLAGLSFLMPASARAGLPGGGGIPVGSPMYWQPVGYGAAYGAGHGAAYNSGYGHGVDFAPAAYGSYYGAGHGYGVGHAYGAGQGIGAGYPTGNSYPYYSQHFGPGHYRHSETGHLRYPYYSYRAPWYFPGPPFYNRSTNYAW